METKANGKEEWASVVKEDKILKHRMCKKLQGKLISDTFRVEGS
jgi:hypothetical protein